MAIEKLIDLPAGIAINSNIREYSQPKRMTIRVPRKIKKILKENQKQLTIK